MKLKRIQRGIWEASDGSFRFELWANVNRWFIYERSTHQADDGFLDEPSFGMRFCTLAEAVEFAESRMKKPIP